VIPHPAIVGCGLRMIQSADAGPYVGNEALQNVFRLPGGGGTVSQIVTSPYASAEEELLPGYREMRMAGSPMEYRAALTRFRRTAIQDNRTPPKSARAQQ
jgi:hypothetical protein